MRGSQCNRERASAALALGEWSHSIRTTALARARPRWRRNGRRSSVVQLRPTAVSPCVPKRRKSPVRDADVHGAFPGSSEFPGNLGIVQCSTSDLELRDFHAQFQGRRRLLIHRLSHVALRRRFWRSCRPARRRRLKKKRATTAGTGSTRSLGELSRLQEPCFK